MELSAIIELIKIGFLGFATAILVFSYLLLTKVMQTEKMAGENLRIRCREIRIFMLMSLAVILIGMGWELLSPTVNVIVEVNPDDIKGYSIKVAGHRIDLSKSKLITLKDERQLTIDLIEIDRTLRGSQNYAEALKRAQLEVGRRQAEQDNLQQEAGL